MGVYIKGYNIEGLKDMLEHCGAEPYLLDVINMTRVPEPHGRLIDADAMCRDLATVDTRYETMIDWCITVTEAQPTVIEAEGE